MARTRTQILAEVRRAAEEDHFPFDDAVVLITALGRRRRENMPSEADDSATEYAATILCFIFDPVKSERTRFISAMKDFRVAFVGISSDPELRALFESSFTRKLLTAGSAREAILLGFEELFVPQLQLRGG